MSLMEEMTFRWIHIMAGVMWVGLLWYFNFVQVPFMKVANAETKSDVSRNLIPRALLFFRMAAATTWLIGVLWLMRRGILVDAFLLRGAPAIIGMGAWLGTIMAFNVWFIIWPCQKKVLGIVEADAETKTRAARSAFLASRVNLLLSLPMLFFMGAYSHGTALFVQGNPEATMMGTPPGISSPAPPMGSPEAVTSPSP